MQRSPALSRTAYLLTGDHQFAEDLLQCALAKTYRHWRRVRDGDPQAYVRRAMHHQHISWWRRREALHRAAEDVPTYPVYERAPAVSGVTAIRLLGWGPDGSAVVVAYQPEPRSPTRFDGPLGMDQRTAYGNVRTVRVLALMPGATAPTTLLTAPDQVLAIDVADNVVASGHTRKADPPYAVGPWFWLWTGLGLAAAVGIALIWRRRRLVRPGGAD